MWLSTIKYKIIQTQPAEKNIVSGNLTLKTIKDDETIFFQNIMNNYKKEQKALNK